MAFERIGGAGAYGAVYVIDATARSSASAFANSVTFGPALSPDGRRLAFTRFADFTTLYDVYVANIDGTAIQHVTGFPQQEGPPTWTPDGAKIVVAGSASSSALKNVYSQSPVANPGDVNKLTSFAAGPGGSLSCPIITDSDVPVAASARGGLALACWEREIDLLSSEGTLLASYVPQSGEGHRSNVFAPSWSPDGARVAFVETTSELVASPGPGNSSSNYSLVRLAVKAMNAGGSAVTTVVAVEAHMSSILAGWYGRNNFSLCWMPDGSRLVFNVPESTLVGHVWVVKVDGTGLARLTSEPDAWDRSVSCSR